MIQLIGRNLALALGKLLLLSVGIFLILQSAANYDNELSFLEFFKSIFSGRLVGESATELPPLEPAFLYSITTLVLALLLSYGFGVPLGLLLGRYRMAWTQVLGHVLISVALAIPAFWVGYVVLYYTITEWRVLIIGETTVADVGRNAYIGKCLLLAIPLSLSGIAIVGRQVFQTLINAFPEDSILSSRSQGITQRMIFDTVTAAVISRPLLRSFPLLLSLFLSVLIVIETTFLVPGFGFAVYKAAEQAKSDLQSLAVLSLWVTIMLLVAHLIVDILIEMIDHRQPATPDTE